MTDDSRALSAQGTNVGAPHGAIRARQGEDDAAAVMTTGGGVGLISRRGFVAASVAGSALASLPCVAAAKPREIIMPELSFSDTSTKIIRDNCITSVYQRMARWNLADGTLYFAKVDSPRYREWLLDLGPFDIAPHFLFGGCVVPDPNGDPTFYPRWQAFARELTLGWWATALNQGNAESPSSSDLKATGAITRAAK